MALAARQKAISELGKAKVGTVYCRNDSWPFFLVACLWLNVLG